MDIYGKVKFGVESIVGTIFLVLGIFVFVLGIFFGRLESDFQKTAIEIPAVISDIESYRDSDGDRHHRTYVTYKYKDREYESRLGYYSSGMQVGDDIKILCDPEDPTNIGHKNGGILGIVICCGIGGVFAIIGGSLVIVPRIANAKRKKLMNSGRELFASYVRSELNTSYSVNGEHPWQLVCTYTDDYSGSVYEFRSENLWYDPGFLYREGDSVQVFVNPQNYSEYAVVVDMSRVKSMSEY